MPDRLTLLTFLARLSGRVTCHLSRALVKELGRRGLVVTGYTFDGKLVTEPARPYELPDADWPECNALTTGQALGSGGGGAEA